MNRIQEIFSVSESLLENMIESNLRKKLGIFVILPILLSFIVSCKVETSEAEIEPSVVPVENMVEIEASKDKAEDIFTFFVRDLDEVRLTGQSAEDFYIINTGMSLDTIYYI